MSRQFLSIEQMNHLQELGIDTNKASMCLLKPAEGKYHIFEHVCPVPTFSLLDILDSLPVLIEHDFSKFELRIKRFVYENGKIMYAVLYEKQDSIDWYIMQSNENLIDSAYEMLCWCILNGYIKNY